MKSFSRMLAVMLAVLLAMIPVLSLAEATDVMITVGSKEITRDDVQVYYDYFESYYSSYLTTDLMWGYAVNTAIQEEVITQMGAKLGLDVFTAEEEAAMKQEAADEFADVLEQYLSYFGTTTEESTDEEKLAERTNALVDLEASYGYTEEAFYSYIKNSAVYDRVVEAATSDVTATDEEVAAYFTEMVASDQSMYEGNIFMYEYYTMYMGESSYYVPEGYRSVIHILMYADDALMQDYQNKAAQLEEQAEAAATEATGDEQTAETAAETTPVTQEDVDAAKAAVIASVQDKIDDIYASLQAGATFEEMITKYNEDPGMQDADTLAAGYMVNKDSVVWDPVFVEAAMSIQNVGDVSDPYVSSYGVHIVKYVRDVPAGAVEMTDAIKEEVRAELLSDATNTAFDAKMTEWESELGVTMSDEAATYRTAILTY